MTTSQGRRAVIFDMDGVLCRYDLRIRLEALGRLSGRSPEEVERLIWGSGFEDDADSGRYTSGEEYLDEFGDGSAIRSAAPMDRSETGVMTPRSGGSGASFA